MNPNIKLYFIELGRDLFFMVFVAFMCAVVVFCCSACSSYKNVEKTTSVVKTDSVSAVHHDSIIYVSTAAVADTVIQTHYIYIKVDSAGNEKSRVEWHDTYRSVAKDKQTDSSKTSSDSVKDVQRSDSIQTVYSTVVKQASLSLTQRIFIWLGKCLSVVALIIAGVVFFNIRKNKC